MYFLYPETKGVPLEEMDAVFGEGKYVVLLSTTLLNTYHFTEELEERLEDEESERSSLVSRRSRRSRSSITRMPLREPQTSESSGFFGRLFGGSSGRREAPYEPIQGGDE